MAATKEAIAVVLDVGAAMSQGPENGPTPLQNAVTCIEKILQRKIFAESKDEVALILFGTNETDNLLSEEHDGEYMNISVVRSLKQVDWDLFDSVKNIQSTTNQSDFVDALVVGMDVLVTQAKGKKIGEQRILLISNFGSDILQDNMKQIILGMKNSNFQLNVIGPKCYSDEEDELTTPDGKTASCPKAEQVIGKILKEVDGESYTFEEALPALTYYQKKKVQSAVWNADLEITPSLILPVSGYIKVTQNHIKPWKTAYAQDPEARIMRETSFHLNDDAQTEVDKDEIDEGFRYGSSIIPFTKDDRENMQYEIGAKGIKVLGFTKRENIKRHHYMGDRSQYFVAAKENEPVQMALAAFIQALHETDQVAIVRHVYSGRSAPKIGFMAPLIKQKYECLVFIQLPYSEDLHQTTDFRQLNANKKHIPSSDQLKAVDDLIDVMDLLQADTDEEGNRVEAFKSKDLCNPHIQRLFQCLQHRAFHPGEPLPAMPEHLRTQLAPPTELVNLAKPVLESIKRLFPIKDEIKTDQKSGSRMFQNGESKSSDEPAAKKPRGSLSNNVCNLVVGNTVTQVGTINPVENFKQLISQENVSFTEVCQQLEKVIRQLFDDQRDALHTKALDCLKVYREEVIEFGNCTSYNAFLQSLKTSLIAQNKAAWDRVVSGVKLLISNGECPRGGVSTEVVSHFLVPPIGQVNTKEAPKDEEPDADDLLSEMDH